MKEHNDGKSPSTKNRIPFELVYFESYKSEKDARKRETMLKLRGNALTQLKERILNSLESPHDPCGCEDPHTNHLDW